MILLIFNLEIFTFIISVCFDRTRIHPNINFNGSEINGKTTLQQKQSFIFIGEDFRVENVKFFLKLNGRDFDVLEETLGRIIDLLK